MDWNKEAKNLLKSVIAKKGVKYADLETLLNNMGVNENAYSIANKINRGTFNLAFFLQCMKALEVSTINLD